jgi:LacI family transcriptional regulator, galactose operon repressor
MVDIARVAKVSQTTVSLVLNQVEGIRIAEDTRQRVLSVARELGYLPAPALRAFGRAGTKLFGVVIDEISAAYPSNLIDGLQSAAEARAAELIIQITGGRGDRETAALENFARLAVSGVIYATTFTRLVQPPRRLDAFPHVFLNCRRKDKHGLSVLPDERRGGKMAAQHLIDAGCKRIATITGDPWQSAATDRLAGFRLTLQRNGLSCDPACVRHGDWGHESGWRSTRELLALERPPDGLFCQNDVMARGALVAIEETGLRVPHDIAVVGYDDRDFAKNLRPPLTTISLPHAEMAEQALAQLTGQANDRTASAHRVSGALIIRASC